MLKKKRKTNKQTNKQRLTTKKQRSVFLFTELSFGYQFVSLIEEKRKQNKIAPFFCNLNLQL